MCGESANANERRLDGGVTRRTFLGVGLASAAALLTGRTEILGVALSPTPSLATNSVWKLGGDLPVNRLGFGAMRLTGEGNWGWPADRNNALNVLKRAVQLGVNLIDTADEYGPGTSELLIAEALYPYPTGLVIATKGGIMRLGRDKRELNGRPDYLKGCVEKSLKRLRLERIDLYQLHRVDPKVPLEESLGALKEMQSAGKIRHVGLSEVGPEEIERARKVLPIASVQNRYNIDDRKWENALAYCENAGIGFMPWNPIGGTKGLKASDALETAAKAHGASVRQVELAWLMQRSPVMLPIPGTANVAHLEENVGAAKIKLTPEEWESIDTMVGKV